MNLKHLTDTELLSSTTSSVKNETAATTQVLHHFREIERRRLYSAQKFCSLYEMAIKIWGYTEDQAMYRISAMRMLKELPEIEEKISDGRLTLTHLNMARTHFRKEKKHSSIEPSRELKLEILGKLERVSARETKKVLRSYSSLPIEIPRDEIKPLTDDLVLVKFAAEKCVEDQTAHLKGLLAHSHPDISLGELYKKLCDLGQKEWAHAKEPKIRMREPENGTRELKNSSESRVFKNSPGTFRVTPHNNSKAAGVRFVWARDGQKCTNCDSTFAVEKDHRLAKAKGGPDTPENMRLLCRSCNQRAAIETYGLEKMDTYLNKTPPSVKSPAVAYIRSSSRQKWRPSSRTLN